jgi:hypothetical protein
MDTPMVIFMALLIALVVYETYTACNETSMVVSKGDMKDWMKTIKKLQKEEARECTEDPKKKSCKDVRAKLKQFSELREELSGPLEEARSIAGIY